MNTTDIKAELLFVVTKLLEDEGCFDAANYLKNVINEKQLFPARTNLLGKNFANSFENYELVHGPVVPLSIVNNLSKLLELVRKHHPYGRPVMSIFNLGNYIHPEKKSISIPVSIRGFSSECTVPLLGSVYQRMHINHHSLAHRNAIYCLQFDQRGEYIFTGSDDYTIKIWSFNATSKKPCILRHTLRGHVAEIIELTVSPDNHLLASVDSNCCLVIWCLRTGQPVVAFRGCRLNRVISGMTFVSVPRRKEADQNEGLGSSSGAAEFDNDKPTGWLAITSFGGYLHILPYQHKIHADFGVTPGPHRWACCSVKLLPTIRFITGVEGTPNAFWPSVVCMDVSPGNLLLATGCSDQCIRLYNFLSPAKPEASATLRAHEESVNSVAFSHCGLKLASGSSDGGSCWLWRFQAGKWRSMVLSFRKRVKCRPCLLTWSKNDRYLIASMKNGSVYVYLGESGCLYTVIEAHEGAVHAMSPSPLDDEFLATGGVDGRFQVWNIKQHRVATHGDLSSSDANAHVDSSVSSPLLCYYRYPPSEVDPDHGLVWHPFEPSDSLPIWQNAINHRRTQREQTHATPLVFNVRTSLSQNVRDAPSSQPHAQRPIPPTPFRHQRITACRAFPAFEGTGFLVVTKAGLLSVFATNDSDSNPTRAHLEMLESSSMVDLDSDLYAVDEQFFHWELDTAEWREVSFEQEDLQTVQTTLALGSPPAPQSVAGLAGARYDRNGRSTRPNPENRLTPNSSNSPSERRVPAPGTGESSERSAVGYRPPHGVCFEVIHAPSRVPFHRLPPPYFTTLRGVPLSLDYQRGVPGRTHLDRPSDLLPSVTADDELGEDMVVDDIQFSSEIPADYCPTPLQSRTRAIQGKQYLWQSIWLIPDCPLIQPLTASEFKSRQEEQTSLYEEEVKFFLNNGDSRVTFGDEFFSSVSNPDNYIFMQPKLCPELSCHTKTLKATETLSREPSGQKEFTDANWQMNVDDQVNPHELCMLNENTALNQPIDSTPSVLNDPNHVVDGQPGVLSDDNEEDLDGTSEESEWSENIDVDIGWWHRQRRRRPRRQTVTTGTPTTSNVNNRVSMASRVPENVPIHNEYRRTGISHSRRIRSTRRVNRWRRSSLSFSDQRRRSVRQQRLVRCRLQQEKRLAHLRSERDKHLTNLRRSQRSHGHCSLDSAGPSSRELSCRPSSSNSFQEPDQQRRRSLDSTSVNLPTALECNLTEDDLINERRERLKRRLLNSLAFLLRTANRVPLTSYPPGGYTAHDCEGLTYPSEYASRTATGRMWAGPHFDWLSTYHPVPSPYVPQMGDKIVYITRGHREYLRRAWQTGELPQLDNLHCVSCTVRGNNEGEGPSTNTYSPELPWNAWPHILDYVCGEIRSISYTIVRITNNSRCHRNGPPGKADKTPSWRKQRRARGTARIRASEKHAPPHTSFSQNSDDPELNTKINSQQLEDSFVRLVTLHIKLDFEQSYAHLGSPRSARHTGVQQPEYLSISYHDVDGVLEFVILRHLFDNALQHRWTAGDRFVCPVGTAWWRGRIIRHMSDNRTLSLTESTPCCSKTRPHQPDPWLSLHVQWIQNSETGLEQFTAPSISGELESTTSNLPENVDRLSPWDCYRWELAVHLPTSFVGDTKESKLVSVTDQELRILYGTPLRTSTGTNCVTREYDLHGHCERLLGCFDKIAHLSVSALFIAPVDLATYPDYLFVNPYPIDLGLIMARLSTGFYRQSAALRADLQLLLDNTIRYNETDSNIVRNARLLYRIANQFIEDPHLHQRDVQRIYLKFDRELADFDIQVAAGPSTQAELEHTSAASATSSTIHLSHDSVDELTSYTSRVISDQSPQKPLNPPVVQSTSRRWRRTRYRLQSPTRDAFSSSQSSLPSAAPELCTNCADLLPVNWVPTCSNLINTLIANHHSLFFREPIDLNQYPDYLSIVSYPMDLSSIRKRLSATMSIVTRLRLLRSVPQGAYRCPHECIADLNLIISNSRLYNEDPETAVFADTEWLHNWVSEVFVPRISALMVSSNSSLSEKLQTTHTFSNDHTTPRPQRRPAAKPRMRQSKLACRKLTLRKVRGNLLPRNRVSKGLGEHHSPIGTRPTSDLSSPVRTSSGRVVRPPKRNAQTIYFADYSGDSEGSSDPDTSSRQTSHPRRRLRDPVPEFPTADVGLSESSSSLPSGTSRRNKRRRRMRTYS